MLTSRLYSIPRFAVPYTPGDFRAALLAMFRPPQVPDAFGLLGGSPKFWTRSGRQALRLLLSVLHLEPGSGVALPLFTDPSLVTAIVAAGHRPVFIDVHPESLTMDPRSLDAAAGEFSAVVIVHLFGHMADIPGLLAAAGNVPVIEDAAHAPLSFLNGRMAGEFGIASFYSFASTKYWPAGGGGLAVVHEPALAGRMARACLELPVPGRAEEFRNVLLQAAKSVVFSRRLYGVLGKPFRPWAERLALLEPCLDLMAIQRSQAAVARRQASRFALRVERQRENSLRLLEHVSGADGVDGVVVPREPSGARYNYHIFPVLLRDSEERSAVAARMWRQFIDTSTIYSEAIGVCRNFGYRGGCPVAESVASRLLTLPNYANLSNPEIDQVAQIFLSSLKSCRAERPGYPGRRFGISTGSRKAGIPAPASTRSGNNFEPR
jgi:dTDP-4-amino-4,6-dideoxygalactose transaminase